MTRGVGIGLVLRELTGLAIFIGIGSATLVSAPQQAIAQATSTTTPLTFVLTQGENASTRAIPGYASRFTRILGSGELIVNAQEQVTGYYFTISGLNPGTAYTYHFHAAKTDATPTSCEGDKTLFREETGGGVITDLEAIAPLEPTVSGYGFVGSAGNPIQLTNSVPIASIGYLNIHPAPGGEVGPGIICANVRLDAGGFVR